MNYLVDTHIVLWSFLETNRLSEEIKTIFESLQGRILAFATPKFEILNRL
jgi:PIN domain nuclease of toxin-antitoxin system